MKPNRLAGEQSLYLRQHAANPVDWYAWGNEAFEVAREQDRPIFLSIGYATCHWCHVMAHESFENDEVAGLLNRAFVAVKVDREERPDVDAVYMTVCQMMTGHGGWPLTVVLTPDLEPFFAGTYFPRTSRGGRIGMLELLPRIESLWRDRREDVDESAASITEALRTAMSTPEGEAAGMSEVATARRTLEARFDREHGGFGGAPKFPSPHTLTFLLRVWERSGDAAALDMATTTLHAMRRGGIHDQLGGGFHRYSTDAEWRLPHFEKMLYDQAMIALAYTEAWQATGDDAFAVTVRRTLDYVLGDLCDAAGGFHSAEDADSEGEEGKYYVWTESELAAALPDDDDLELAIEAFGVEPEGNFRDEATGRRSGANVLLLAKDPAGLAGKRGESREQAAERIETIRRRLLEVRAERVRPERDDKILADWNGLAIAALARAGRVFEEPRYADAASRAADFIHSALRTPEGRPLHRWRAGDAAIPALADDMAFVAWGMIELYETTYEPRWLERALERLDELIERFEAPGGGFFQTAADVEATLVRVQESSDGALPSANSVASLTLLRAARLAGRADLEAAARRTLQALGGRVSGSPAGHTAFLQAALFEAGPTAEVVVTGPADGPATRRLLAPLRHGFHPRTVTLLRPSDDAEAAEILARLAPFTKTMQVADGVATAYLCRDHTCEFPRTDPAALEGALEEV
ncbi:MAG TPA: thioredoxin domain-containing protein [Gemmatimonadota bacterium]|nr:thioredoxin domain-containing protein [Gemmatimonadota bacterium]